MKENNLKRRGVIYQILGNSSLYVGQELPAKIANGDVRVLKEAASQKVPSIMQKQKIILILK